MSDIDDVILLRSLGLSAATDDRAVFVLMGLDIVRDLAERGPFIATDHLGVGVPACVDCQTFDYPRAPLNNPANHEPTCLWRRAKVLYPGGER